MEPRLVSPKILVEMGRFSEALHSYICQYRITESPEDLANIAGCLYKLGRFTFALKFALKALQNSGDDCKAAVLVVANIHSERGNYSDAIRYYLSLTQSSVSLKAYEGLVAILEQRGNFSRAKYLLGLVSSRYPNESRPYLLLAKLFFKRLEYKFCWDAVRQCLELDSLCIEAWRLAFHCSKELKEYNTALSIAKKLIELDSENPRSFEYLGQALFELNQSDECAEAYANALRLDEDNLIYYLNAKIRFTRVPASNFAVESLEKLLIDHCSKVAQELTDGRQWKADTSCALLPFAYYCAYSTSNLRLIYEQYYQLLTRVFRATLEHASTEADRILEVARSRGMLDHSQSLNCAPRNCSTRLKIRIGMVSRYFSAHSNSQAFLGLIQFLSRDQFEIILIHRHGVKIDRVHLHLNSLVDEVVYLDSSLGYAGYLFSSLDLDILFFTDLGMDPYDFFLPELRRCPIQITGWGLPHTSGLDSIHYYLSSNLLETSSHQTEYTEKLIPLDGLPCCFLSSELYYRRVEREYFLLPEDRLLIGCIQNFWKIHPDFDEVVEQISLQLPDAVFVFVASYLNESNQFFFERLSKRAPNAFANSIFLSRCDTKDFLSLCDCIDILLDTPYYGAGVTAYMSMYVGTPTVCFKGERLRDGMTAAIYRFLEVSQAPIANCNDDYVGLTVDLAVNFSERLRLKRETVDKAHKLYNNPQYVRSFEAFCQSIVSRA